MAAFAAAPYTGPYSISKYAVKHFSDCLRAEMAPHDIGVTVVCPGLISSNLSASAGLSSLLNEEQSATARAVMLKVQALLGMHPDKAGRQIVDAITRNTAVAPIRPEARIACPLARWFPGVVRTVMTVAARPDIGQVRSAVDRPGVLHRVQRVADRIPFRDNKGVADPKLRIPALPHTHSPTPAVSVPAASPSPTSKRACLKSPKH
ncbi:SDR family NAD(P)-dependent oxidoreductase [Nocardia uniformis]|uniref:SDR family NAD(P)-dependent oxidoreductase n=2 Tax=Nocardia uniformis TaxID=53432 RepID=A0A849BZZ1_9NOCA|nr:SDR family NAD(P)-dependent oxidoreductase [Nocardia uniformis]